MSVIELKAASSQPDEEVINRLEQALHLAKTGELRSVAIFSDTSDGGTFTSYASPDVTRLLGAVAVLQHNMLRDMTHIPAEET